MSLFTLTINNLSTGLDKKSAECAMIQRMVGEAMKEFGRGQGTVTSGTIATYDTRHHRHLRHQP
jgi:hypothetical protein